MTALWSRGLAPLTCGEKAGSDLNRFFPYFYKKHGKN